MEKIATKATNSPRATMGTSAATTAVNASAAPSKNTTLVKKKSAKSLDPTRQSNSHGGPKQLTSGARYGIRVSIPAYQPSEAGKTMSESRLFKPAINRSSPNFRAAASEAVA